MELQLILKGEKDKKFKKCPACGCTHLIEFNVDQFCSKCDWDSLMSYVQSGRMNNLSKAVREHGFVNPISRKKEVKAKNETIEDIPA